MTFKAVNRTTVSRRDNRSGSWCARGIRILFFAALLFLEELPIYAQTHGSLVRDTVRPTPGPAGVLDLPELTYNPPPGSISAGYDNMPVFMVPWGPDSQPIQDQSRPKTFCVTITPQPLKASALSLGTGRDFGLWTVDIATEAPIGSLSRPEILNGFPHGVLLEFQAVDVLTRKSQSGLRSLLAAITEPAQDLSATGLVYAGTRVSNPYVRGGLVASGALMGIFAARAARRVPKPDETIKHLLPDSGLTGVASWTGLILTGRVSSARQWRRGCAS